MKKNTLIISPSGNFYGSEQVLQDFLTHTKSHYTVFVPKNSLLSTKVDRRKHELKVFSSSNLYVFYCRVFILLLQNRYSTVYVNEGGHINWIKFLSHYFRNRKFVVHLRLIEDVETDRILNVRKNVSLVTISKFLSAKPTNLNIDFVYDPYHFNKDKKIVAGRLNKPKLKIGIIGRVSVGKGVKELLTVLRALKQRPNYDYFEFHLFGDIVRNEEVDNTVKFIKEHKNVFFNGFVKDKSEIYRDLDIVLHLSKNEPLGRIFFEALDYSKPIIGPNSGGIGELGRLLSLEELLFSYETEQWEIEILTLLNKVRINYTEYVDKIERSKKIAYTTFDVNKYVQKIEDTFQHEQ